MSLPRHPFQQQSWTLDAGLHILGSRLLPDPATSAMWLPGLVHMHQPSLLGRGGRGTRAQSAKQHQEGSNGVPAAP